MLAIYRLLLLVVYPFLPLYLRLRVLRDKEDSPRLSERYGVASNPRPKGVVIWLHAASIGESIAALVLAKNMLRAKPRYHVLLTSGTVTSAALIARRAQEYGLGGRLIHQYIPLDYPSWVRRFLEHWQPQLAVMVESDLWPNIILETAKKNIPLVMASAQLSERSLAWWLGIGQGLARRIFPLFNKVFATDEIQAKRLARLPLVKDSVAVGGSLKASAPPLADSPELRTMITKSAARRKIIALLSSHEGEEELFLQALSSLDKETYFAIITPRHPNRIVKTEGFTSKTYSGGERPTASDNIFIVDALGMLGGIIRTADIIVLGGGFAKLGGHNPMEVAALGKGLISGKHIFKNQTSFDLLRKHHGVIFCQSAKELQEQITTLLKSPRKRRRLNDGAMAAYKALTDETNAITKHSLNLITEST